MPLTDFLRTRQTEYQIHFFTQTHLWCPLTFPAPTGPINSDPRRFFPERVTLFASGVLYVTKIQSITETTYHFVQNLTWNTLVKISCRKVYTARCSEICHLKSVFVRVLRSRKEHCAAKYVWRTDSPSQHKARSFCALFRTEYQRKVAVITFPCREEAGGGDWFGFQRPWSWAFG